jgi:hypothetical protein
VKRLDPEGKRALFEAPVSVDRRALLNPGTTPVGKEALYSTGPPRPGTVVVECGECRARSRVSLPDLGMRMLTGSLFLPGRPRPHWLKCPACGHRNWCRIGWAE